MDNEKIKELYAQVKSLSDEAAAALGAGVVMVTGHVVSPKNAALARMQHPECSTLGGFHQWLDAGRCVSKGETAIVIRGFSKRENAETGEESTYFPSVSVFDVSQTRELTEEEKARPRKERKTDRTTERSERQEKPERKPEGISAALYETAKRRLDAAEKELGRERLTNTHRRAEIARGMIAEAEREQAKANAIIRLHDEPGLLELIVGAGRKIPAKFDDARALLDLPEFAAGKSHARAVIEAKQASAGSGIDFFPTKPELARKMARLARLTPLSEVLEPSCGHGALILGALAECPGVSVHGLELSRSVSEVARLQCPTAYIEQLDFETWEGGDHYDAVIMNPPFSRDQQHIKKAWGHLAPGGRLVAIAGESAFGSKDKSGEFSRWLDGIWATVEKLDGDCFDGTNANARLIVADKYPS